MEIPLPKQSRDGVMLSMVRQSHQISSRCVCIQMIYGPGPSRLFLPLQSESMTRSPTPKGNLVNFKHDTSTMPGNSKAE
jgi:hypothetical protein